ncbi:Cell division protein FtsZ [uncultured Alphaproteobacteria bacterium]|uniref:Cell division protein FtsZ n=1 Tax=uncultured Alphaproteobacteria bacterium TaxID=91750 RepID=A0A212JKH8_9PROT|nr:Cell division protein FtsZ [uncultured Alphaproteobacteria bacterium]
MPINLGLPQAEATLLKPRILVIGVGGAGGNAVNNMIQSELEGVEFLVTNTDAQALSTSRSNRCIQLGASVTQGLGAGARPEIGRRAAEESLEEIVKEMQGANMAFITAGMGGGTGTGAAPVIASAARELGILTVGVVTKPFDFEGLHRRRLADKGIEELQQYVDTLIVIPNQNLFRVATEKTTFADAFKMADDVLHSGVRSVTDLMIMPGLINLDFADVRTVMEGMGKAMMGTGEAEGEERGVRAAEMAIANPLLDDTSMAGAKGVLINITGGPDLGLYEADEAANRIRSEVDEDANIIFGSCFDERLAGKIRVSVVATGIGGAVAAKRPEERTPAVSTQPAPQPTVQPPQPPTPPSGGPKGPLPEKAADPLGLSLFDRPAAPAAPVAPAQIDAFIPAAPMMPEEMAIPAQPEPQLAAEPAPQLAPAPVAQPDDAEARTPRRWALWGNAHPAKPLVAPHEDVAQNLAVEPEDRSRLSGGLAPEIDNIPAFLRRQAN